MVRNCIKKRVIFTALCLISAVFMFSSLSAKTYVLGGKKGWQDFAKQENVTTGKGRYGYDSIELASNSFKADQFTDLIIDFENPENPISDGDYQIVQNNLKIADDTINERHAGLSRNMGGLSIFGKPGTYFGSEGFMGSFSIEFWLCPSLAENGETIINWESSKNEDGQLVYQAMYAVFDKGHLNWSFSNFFDVDVENVSKDIVLNGVSKIIPDKWSLHTLSYDSETGELSYKVNSITEVVKYVTSNGREDGQNFLVKLGTPSEIHFCSEYTGKIDDIRIMRVPYSQSDFKSADNAGSLDHAQYLPEGGRFVTKPIIVSKGSTLDYLKAEMNVPEQTDVNYFVRSGDNFYGWTDTYPEWKHVESGEKITGVTGLYFQVAAELMPDGNCAKTPSITSITLEFTELPEPLPPFIVKAVAGDGSVTISWNYSVDDTAGGYYLYYGTRPGEYLGRMAIEGESPINVGNVTSYTVTGLENGKIYYFAVAAWSSYDMRVVGNISKEVFARPRARLKK